MLVLPIKKKWFDMILAGEKQEEYREIKDYYIVRLKNIGLIRDRKEPFDVKDIVTDKVFTVIFRNGYKWNSPSFSAKVTLSVGRGREEWGAEPNKMYFKFKIIKIVFGVPW